MIPLSFLIIVIFLALLFRRPVGVMLAFLYTIVLLPALICIFPVKQSRPLPGVNSWLRTASLTPAMLTMVYGMKR